MSIEWKKELSAYRYYSLIGLQCTALYEVVRPKDKGHIHQWIECSRYLTLIIIPLMFSRRILSSKNTRVSGCQRRRDRERKREVEYLIKLFEFLANLFLPLIGSLLTKKCFMIFLFSHQSTHWNAEIHRYFNGNTKTNIYLLPFIPYSLLSQKINVMANSSWHFDEVYFVLFSIRIDVVSRQTFVEEKAIDNAVNNKSSLQSIFDVDASDGIWKMIEGVRVR